MAPCRTMPMKLVPFHERDWDRPISPESRGVMERLVSCVLMWSGACPVIAEQEECIFLGEVA